MALPPHSIIIDPRFIISYISYYIYGIKKQFPSVKIKFRNLGIPVETELDYRYGCAMKIIYPNHSNKNLFIDTHDSNLIHHKYYDWADLYAKINLNINDKNKAKILAIGPSFAIKLWNPVYTLITCIRNYKHAKNTFPLTFSTYLRDYCYLFIRRKKILSISPLSTRRSRLYICSINIMVR